MYLDGIPFNILSYGIALDIFFEEEYIDSLFWNSDKKLYEDSFLVPLIVDFKCEDKLAYEFTTIESNEKIYGYFSFVSNMPNNILYLKNTKAKGKGIKFLRKQ
tara:strand:- start:420 stop:728 length:309 start_codon:yes stop_codon:yes gene_type:complete